MKPTIVAAVAMGATAVLITAAGCGDKSSTESSSSSSSTKSASSSATPKADKDYSKLLISADAIEAPGDTFTAQAPTVNPGGKPGVATVFSNADDTHEIGDTIFVLPDADAARTALQGAVDAFGASVTGGTPESVDVGDSATAISGTSVDGSKAVSVLVFTQGPAFVTLEFDSAPGDPVPPEAVVEIGKKQAAAVKAGLAG